MADILHGKNRAKPREWNTAHAILLIIVLQAGFMIFMASQGPSFGNNEAKGDPNQRLKTKSGWNAKKKTESRNALGAHQAKHKKRYRLDNNNAERLQEEPPQKIISERNQETAPKKLSPLTTKPPQVTTPPQYKEMAQVEGWDVNSGNFPGALHLHFSNERHEPSFRRALKLTNEKWEDAAKDASALLINKKQTIKSCQYYHADEVSGSSIRVIESCLSPEKSANKYKGLIAYNSQSFPRIWCGKTIDARHVQHYHKHEVCNETARILLESDRLLGSSRADLKRLPPVVFIRNNSDAKIESVQDCDVPCKFTMDTCGDKKKGTTCLPAVADFTVEDTDFKFKYSMMDPRDAPEVNIMRKGYRDHQFYATRSFASEIPLSNFDWDKYGEITSKNDFKNGGEKGICFVHVEPCTGEIRPGVWAKKIQDAFKGNFDAYGPCNFPKMTMKDTELDVYDYKDRQKIMKEYMFTLVIGQSQTPDFVQEMVWDALQAGSIPVYFGAPNIKEHVPPASVISGAEFSSREALAEYLERVSTDESEWKKYHMWRDDETQHLEEKYGFLKEKSSSSYCRMCRWALATKYALGWNVTTQTIQPPAVDRTFCVNSKNEVKGPFVEHWMSDLGMQEPKGKKICEKYSAIQTMEFDDISLTRTVSSHDNGVIDMEITDIRSLRNKGRIVLRLDFHDEIHNVEGAHVSHPHQLLSASHYVTDHIPLMSSIAIEDSRTRVTVLANWATELMTPSLESTIDVLIQDLRTAGQDESQKDPDTGFYSRLSADDTRRIRLIVEDVNALRDVPTEYSISPFASQMIKDFLDPLMYFYVE